MAGIFQVRHLEARKQALAAESELYRQILKLEVENLRLSSARARRRFSVLGNSAQWLLLGAPVAGSLLRTRRMGRLRLFTTALMAWRMYQRIAPLCQQLFSHWTLRSDRQRAPANQNAQAASSNGNHGKNSERS